MTKLPKTIVTCRECCGTGTRELSTPLQRVLDVVNRRGRCHAEQIAKAIRWAGTLSAINNRLEDLRGFGLVTRQREGKFWIYSPNQP